MGYRHLVSSAHVAPAAASCSLQVRSVPCELRDETPTTVRSTWGLWSLRLSDRRQEQEPTSQMIVDMPAYGTIEGRRSGLGPRLFRQANRAL